MPAVKAYLEQGKTSPEQTTELCDVIQKIVSGHDEGGRDVRFPEEDVWPHIIPTLNPQNVTVEWSAHASTLDRTEEWVSEISQRLADAILSKLISFGFPENTNVCVDGVLLDPEKLTGFARTGSG